MVNELMLGKHTRDYPLNVYITCGYQRTSVGQDQLYVDLTVSLVHVNLHRDL